MNSKNADHDLASITPYGLAAPTRIYKSGASKSLKHVRLNNMMKCHRLFVSHGYSFPEVDG